MTEMHVVSVALLHVGKSTKREKSLFSYFLG